MNFQARKLANCDDRSLPAPSRLLEATGVLHRAVTWSELCFGCHSGSHIVAGRLLKQKAEK